MAYSKSTEQFSLGVEKKSWLEAFYLCSNVFNLAKYFYSNICLFILPLQNAAINTSLQFQSKFIFSTQRHFFHLNSFQRQTTLILVIQIIMQMVIFGEMVCGLIITQMGKQHADTCLFISCQTQISITLLDNFKDGFCNIAFKNDVI